jgi:hypothetical protein
MNRFKYLILAVLAFGSVVSANAATLNITPDTQDAVVGNSFSANVVFDSQGKGLGLGAYNFDFAYDSSRLVFQSATFGSGLDVFGLGSLQATKTSTASINFYELSFDSTADILANQSSAFTLVTLHFTTLATGSSTLGLTGISLADASGADLAFVTNSAQVNVAAVPEPESYAMLLAGLGLMGLIARRKKQNAA